MVTKHSRIVTLKCLSLWIKCPSIPLHCIGVCCDLCVACQGRLACPTIVQASQRPIILGNTHTHIPHTHTANDEQHTVPVLMSKLLTNTSQQISPGTVHLARLLLLVELTSNYLYLRTRQQCTLIQVCWASPSRSLCKMMKHKDISCFRPLIQK